MPRRTRPASGPWNTAENEVITQPQAPQTRPPPFQYCCSRAATVRIQVFIMRFYRILLMTLFFQLSTVLASSGDRSPLFSTCVSSCESNFCTNEDLSFPLPPSLRLTRWTCLDDCKYGCMQLITDEAIRDGTRIHQYYGKWPFWRLWGMQEPASVAFSLMNLFVHIRGGLQVVRRMSTDHPMRPYFLLFAVISANAWIWSAVFHTRGRLTQIIGLLSSQDS